MMVSILFALGIITGLVNGWQQCPRCTCRYDFVVPKYTNDSTTKHHKDQQKPSLRVDRDQQKPSLRVDKDLSPERRSQNLAADISALQARLAATKVDDRLESLPIKTSNPGYENALWDPKGLTKFPIFKTFPKALATIPLHFAAEVTALWDRMKPYRDEGARIKYGLRGMEYNGMYGQEVASMLYSVIRHCHSVRVIEIGAGFSTFVSHAALEQNAKDYSMSYDHVVVEPYRSDVLSSIKNVSVIKAAVQTIQPKFFAENLYSNDILFIDSAHVVRQFGDVIYEYLHVLPLLRPGVIVHVHDQCGDIQQGVVPCLYYLPQRGWTETELLLAFLYKNPEWKTLLLNSGSWWLQKIHPIRGHAL